MRRNQISLLLLCMVLVSMPLVMHNTASSTGTASPVVFNANIPESNGAMNAILQVGSQLYYRIISEESNVTSEYIIKYSVTGKTASEISYDMYKYVQINDTLWAWSYLDDQVENYTYDLYYHSHSIATTLPSMTAVNQSENTDALFLADMNSSAMIYSSYTNASAPWHAVTLECYHDDNPEDLVKIIWMANKTTGLVTYFEQQMETTSTTELIGFDIAGYTHDQPNSFGLQVGDTVDRFRPEIESSSKKDEEEPAKWLRDTVKYIYYNPHLNIDRIIFQEDIYSDPRMLSENLLQTRPLNTQSYINRSNLNAVYGPFFYKDLNWQSLAFEDSLRAILTHDPPEGPGVEISTFTNGTDWAEIVGVDHNEYEITLFVQQLKNADINIGTHRYMSMISRNSTTGEKFGEITITIDCSAGGMISSSPSLGVTEGDWWTYLVEEHQWENYWAMYEPSFNYREDVLHYVKFIVTHIFAGNKTVMAVIGRMEMWSSDHPDPKIKGFEPFLVWDTTDPTSFMTMGGHTDRLNGPPVLLPQGVDWSTQATAMNVLLGNIFESGTIKTNYQPQAIRIHVIEKENTDEEWYRHEETIILETRTNGVVAHLTRDYQDEYNFNNDTFSKGHNRQEKFDAFLYNATFSSSLIDPATYTNIVPGNVFVWQRSRYRPYETGNDPAHKDYSKLVMNNVISSYDGAVVFIGSRFWKNWDAPSYQPETWHTYDWDTNTIIDTGINLWLLGSIRPGEIWTWVRSQFYERTITDFSLYTSTIVDILNVMLPLPPSITITMSDITTSGRSFQVSVTANEGGEDITYVMRWAMNDQGILQDMFQGAKYTNNGTWREWERQVLVGGSLTTQYGEYFLDGIPSNYVPWDGVMTETGTSSTTTNPFDFEIPGYPLLIVCIFALFGVIVIFRRMRKQN